MERELMDTATKFAEFTAAGDPGNWSAIDPRRVTYLALLDMAQRLARENKELQDRLWAASRQAHVNDEWEPGEDG